MKRLFKQFSFPGGIPSHVAPETPGLDPRRRRARLCAVARLRRRLRQSRPDRRLRRRRRRGRDRPAGDELALQQVPEPGDATARCCRSCTSTATRSPIPTVLARISHEELRPAVSRLRLHAVLRRGRRPGDDAPADGGHARHASSTRSSASRRDARERRRHRAAALADDRAAHAQGLDRPEGGRRQADRGLLARAPGADGRDARQPGARAASSKSG